MTALAGRTSALQRVLAVTLAVMLAISAYLAVVVPAVHYATKVDGGIAEDTLRLNKFRALAADLQQIEKALQRVNQHASNDHLYLSGSTPALVAASLQTRLKMLAEENHGTIVSVSPLTPVGGHGLTRIAVSASLRLPMDRLQAFFLSLEAGRPLLFVDRLSVRSMNAAGPRSSDLPEVPLFVDLELSGYSRTLTTPTTAAARP